MLKSIKNLSIDLKLKYRFACRRMGIPGYQIHQIALQKQQLIYIPVPKNGCTTIKQAFYRMEFGTLFDSDQPGFEPFEDIHDYYKRREAAFTDKDLLRANNEFTRFAVIRDPVDRLISCYRNRVIDLGDLEGNRAPLKKQGLSSSPDINTFVLNLRKYRKANKSIEHHSRPQSAFFSGTLSYLDKIYPIEKLDELQIFLKSYKPALTFLSRKSGGTSFSVSDLSEEALRHAVNFYRQDYRLLSKFYRADVHLNRAEKQQTGYSS
jgi:hypothetical protein